MGLGWAFLNIIFITISITRRGDHFQFDSVFIKKNNQTKIFLKKMKIDSNRLVWVRFFRIKTSSNRFGSVFFCLGSFGFFSFRLIKPNRPVFSKF